MCRSTWNRTDSSHRRNTTRRSRRSCRPQLDQLNQQIAANQAKLATNSSSARRSRTQVAILNSQIQEAQLEIKQRNLTIQQVQDQIAQAQAGISDREHRSVRRRRRRSRRSSARPTRSTKRRSRSRYCNGSLQEAFADISDFETLQTGARQFLYAVASAKERPFLARANARDRRTSRKAHLLQAQQAQETSLQDTETQKQNLIAETKGQESIYQQIIANQQQNAAQIEAALFALRDTDAVRFLRRHLRLCERSERFDRRPARVHHGHPFRRERSRAERRQLQLHDRDEPERNIPDLSADHAAARARPEFRKGLVQAFVRLGRRDGSRAIHPVDVAALPEAASRARAGRTRRIRGIRARRPSRPRSTWSDLGADAGTAAAEREAALKYFAGGSWQNPAFAFYGNDVMCLTQKMQQQIDIINGGQISGSIDRVLELQIPPTFLYSTRT